MSPFFITGFPRSRTAWLSNYMTYRDSVCLHDVFRFCKTPEAVGSLIESIDAKYVGVSDPCLCLFAREFVGLFPMARWVIIERDIEAVRKFFGQLQSPDQTESLWVKALPRLRDMSLHIDVEFNQINAELGRIAQWCVPGFDCPKERTESMTETNIQVPMETIIKHQHATLNVGKD